jgi:uncharacterized protein with HEPN domain
LKKDLTYLEVIIEAINAIQVYTEGVSQQQFLANDILKDAVLMKLIVIGEYGSKLSHELKSNFADVEWQMIKASRNFYVHVYNKVNFVYVWETVKADVPKLKPKIEAIIKVLDKN